MGDVRSLLKNEKAARRIQHQYASYSTTGTLLCTVCRLQLKSESLWEGHLRSAGHLLRAQKLRDNISSDAEQVVNVEGGKRKRDAYEEEEVIPKRTKGPTEQPDVGSTTLGHTPTSNNEFHIPSRPATPMKPVPVEAESTSQQPVVNEDEWAAFEADIASAQNTGSTFDEGVISAPAISAAALAEKDRDEDNKSRRARQEAEMEGDKEDAARKLEEEFEEMKGLEERVRRLREKREALRRNGGVAEVAAVGHGPTEEFDSNEDEEDEEDDGWNVFRMKG